MGEGGRSRAAAILVLVAVGCCPWAEGKFVKLGGQCRTESNGRGTFERVTLDDREKCQLACLTQETCVAFEFRLDNGRCELHTEAITRAAESRQDVECFVKEFVPILESKGLNVAVMVAGVFVMHVAFVLKTLLENGSRWRNNQRRRREKQLNRSVRILFDKRGVVTTDNFSSKQLQQLERILGLLRTLSGSLAFGNQTLLANHKSICAARDTAERCAPRLPRRLFVAGGVDPSHTSTFQGTEAVLNDLMDRKAPQGNVAETLNGFQGELAVLYAAYGDDAPWITAAAVRKALVGGSGLLQRWSIPGFQSNPVPRLALSANALKRSKLRDDRGTSMAQLMEPAQAVAGVYARRLWCLSAAVDLRERLGIGSRRLGMATLVLFLALGVVRFAGLVPAAALAAVLAVQLLLELLSACELRASGRNLCTIAARVAMPVTLALVVAAFLHVSGGRPVESNAEIEGRFTFLPVPPQYSLETISSQRLYVGIVYGIMHGNLAVLCALPVPISYGLQALLVQACPRLRFLVPQSAVWWHRLLGYMLVGGLSVTGMIWLVFQGQECYLNQNIQSCEAFEPQLAAGIDVYVLRFHIVWPLMFFFIPLMIWGRYPESWEGALRPKATEAGRSASRARASSSPGDGAASGVLGFLYRRLQDVVPLAVVLAGCHHVLVEEFNIFFPFWFVNLALLLLQTFFRARSFVASLLGDCCCLKRSDQMAEFFRKSWWEAAYSSHVFAVVTMSFFAVFYRLEVFYPIFLTWGLYFLDRLLFLYRAYAHRADIVVGEATSSYVVNCGEGDRAEPSHVRLVVKKPPGFRYKAGQWCQVAMPQCGAYWGSPSLCLPFMQWHAFSIASKPTDDYLEFHIGVHISRGMFDAQQRVTAAKSEGETFLRLSRSGKLLDWLCPHRVPYPDARKEVRGEFTVESAGMYLTLQGEDGIKLKALRPQVQWTGRLWNVVQRMLEANGRSGKAAAGQAVHIAGPYGALPWTIDAHEAVMLVGAGVGFPSTGAMLRQLLEDNLARPAGQQKSVCFIWTASKLDQLLLCFPSLLVDLSRYVHRRNGQLRSGVEDLKAWLHVKIFVSNFEPGEFLSLNPGQVLFPESGTMAKALDEVREWLLGQEVVVGASGETVDADGTYIAQGSLGASFAGILRRSLFTQRLVERGHSLGISYCGPPELCSLIRSDVANTIFPTKVEFAAEFAA